MNLLSVPQICDESYYEKLESLTKVLYYDNLEKAIYESFDPTDYQKECLKIYKNILYRDVCHKSTNFFSNLWESWLSYYRFNYTDLKYVFISDYLFLKQSYYDYDMMTKSLEELHSKCSEICKFISKKDIEKIKLQCKSLYTDKELDITFHKSIDDKYRRIIKYNAYQRKKVFVCSNISSGKSTLINSLVGKIVCKTKNLACTSKIHYIYDKPFEDHFYTIYDDGYKIVPEVLLTEKSCINSRQSYIGTFFRLVNSDKIHQLVLIDSPGMNNSINNTHKTITTDFLDNGDYDVVLYILNIEYLLTNDDIQNLQIVLHKISGKKLIVLINKVDTCDPEDDDINEIVDTVYATITKYKSDIEIYPISAKIAFFAKQILNSHTNSKEDYRKLFMMSKILEEPGMDLSRYYKDSLNMQIDSLIEVEQNLDNKRVLQILKKSGLAALEKLLQEI